MNATRPAGKRIATQADNVIAKFGSACKLAKAIGAEASTVYRWTYPAANGGTDGLIPGKALRKVLAKAIELGIEITAQDLYPAA